MSEVVYPYIRISDDDQSFYSIENQEVDIKTWCDRNGYTIPKTFIDNGYSARNFNRPGFKEMIEVLKHNKDGVTTIAIAKWKRWGRNLEESWHWIWKLYRAGIKVHCLECPIDISQPRNKLILALYLVEAEVDNDDRILNVVQGMRRAMKNGNWVRVAPVGYLNKRNGDNRPIIVQGPKAEYVRKGFEMVALENKAVIDVYRYFKETGTTHSLTHTHRLLRNVVYSGKILIPSWNREPEELVIGKHDGIISYDLFLQTQDVLTGKKKIHVKSSNNLFPLRGLLICPKCGSLLTGSASKGKSGNYFSYYHCSHGCKERIKVGAVHEMIETILKQIQTSSAFIELYSLVLKDVFSVHTDDFQKELKTLKFEQKQLDDKLVVVDDKFITGELASTDYQRIKQRYQGDLLRIRRRILEMEKSGVSFQKDLKRGVEAINSIYDAYMAGTGEQKKGIVSSIFPEKLTFEKSFVRTPRINKLVEALTVPEHVKIPLGAPRGIRTPLS